MNELIMGLGTITRTREIAETNGGHGHVRLPFLASFEITVIIRNAKNYFSNINAAC